jgi:hypothetical protein
VTEHGPDGGAEPPLHEARRKAKTQERKARPTRKNGVWGTRIEFVLRGKKARIQKERAHSPCGVCAL